MTPRTPLVHPRSYFEGRDGPSLARAVTIVVAEALLVAVFVYWFVDESLGRAGLNAAERAELDHLLGGVLIGVVIGVVLGWLILSAVFHVVLWFGDAAGGFGATAAIVGESELVQIAVLPVSVLSLYLLLGDVPGEPEAAAEFFQRVAGNTAGLQLAVSALGLIWQAYVQAEGFVTTHRIGRTQAYALAFVVGLVGFLLSLV